MNQPTSTPPSAPPQRPSPLANLDAWMAEHPFHPRILPFIVYVLLLMAMSFVRDQPAAYIAIQWFQIAGVSWLLWRYRRFTPELTLSVHWLAVPIGILGAVAWMGLAFGMEALHPWFEVDPAPYFEDMPTGAAWTAMVGRLVAMAAVVPIFEELFFRSALLRSLQQKRTAKIAVIQFVDDLPFIGEWFMRTRVSKWADQFPRPLATEFERTPVGAVTPFAIASTLVLWCLISHIPRDWPGTIACGLLYIFLVWITNRGTRKLGLGPVIWAHAITNAILWGYTLQSGDWRFL